MRTSIHDDVALPPLALTHVVENGDAARRLHDPAKAPAEIRAELGQTTGQAAFRQRCILRTVNPVLPPRGVVAGRGLLPLPRRCAIIFPACTGRFLVLARLRRLEQLE